MTRTGRDAEKTMMPQREAEIHAKSRLDIGLLGLNVDSCKRK